MFRSIGAEEAAWEAVAKEETTTTMAGVTVEEPWIQMAAEDTAEAEGQTKATEDTAEGEREVEMEVTEAAIGGGASRRQIWDQSRMFDPGFLLHISKFDSYKSAFRRGGPANQCKRITSQHHTIKHERKVLKMYKI